MISITTFASQPSFSIPSGKWDPPGNGGGHYPEFQLGLTRAPLFSQTTKKEWRRGFLFRAWTAILVPRSRPKLAFVIFYISPLYWLLWWCQPLQWYEPWLWAVFCTITEQNRFHFRLHVLDLLFHHIIDLCSGLLDVRFMVNLTNFIRYPCT